MCEVSGDGTGVIKTLHHDGNKVLQRGMTVLQIEIQPKSELKMY